MTIEEAKTLLESLGYVVVPKERVRRVSAQATAHHDAIESWRFPAEYGRFPAEYVEHMVRQMFVSLGRELQKHVRVVAADDFPLRVYRVETDIILPKS